MSVDPASQKITVDGRAVRSASAPAGSRSISRSALSSSRSDPEGRRTVFGLLPKIPGLTYVGRLDVHDVRAPAADHGRRGGAPAHASAIRSPRTYWLGVHGADASAIRAALAQRIVIDGRAVRVLRVARAAGGKSVEIELTLAEGRQRIVRRVAEALGLKVEWLHRVAYGPVRLGKLPRRQVARADPSGDWSDRPTPWSSREHAVSAEHVHRHRSRRSRARRASERRSG